jgi:hypothetical protein
MREDVMDGFYHDDTMLSRFDYSLMLGDMQKRYWLAPGGFVDGSGFDTLEDCLADIARRHRPELAYDVYDVVRHEWHCGLSAAAKGPL